MRRKAFTLIEILVAVSIIAILASIVTYGVRSAIAGAQDRQTRVAIENATAMFREAGHNGSLPVPAGWYWQGVYGDWSLNAAGYRNSAGDAFWTYPYRSPDVLGNGEPLVVQPGPVGGDVLLNTVIAYGSIERNPAVLKMVQNMPAGTAKSVTVVGPDSRVFTAVVPLDAWGNPILLIPAAGYVIGAVPAPVVVRPVTQADLLVIQSAAVVPYVLQWVPDGIGGRTPNPQGLSAADQAAAIPAYVAPGSWFCVSAGKDGDVSTAGDNVP